MTFLKTLARAAGLGLCVAALSGTALADPGNGNGNGPAVAPPGQEKKAETPAATAPAPAPQAAQGQAQKAENQAKQAAKKAAPKPAASKSAAAKAAAPGQAKKAEKQAEHKPAKADKPAKTSGSYKETSQGDDKKKGMDHKHTICHATGSDSNPYVQITPSVSGVFNGHMGHQGGEDIVPPFVYKGTTYSQNWDAAGQAIFANGCAAPAASAPLTPVTPSSDQKQEKHDCPTVTRTETVVTGVLHATGAFNKDGTRKYVEISPSQASAHYDRAKHPDDKILTQQVTTTVATGAKCDSDSPPAAQVTVTPTGQQPTVQPTVQPTAQPVGGVAGAVSPAAPAAEKAAKAAKAAKAKKAEKPAGGVLGAVASAPEAVAETATTGTLPFTGIPLWIAALIGGALLATGLVLRRSST